MTLIENGKKIVIEAIPKFFTGILIIIVTYIVAKFIEYGISNLKGGTSDIKKLLEQNEFMENEDYLLRKVSEQLSSGTKYKNEYYLHPRAFKICLMRSLKTKKYAKYYLLLEECIKYYND